MFKQLRPPLLTPVQSPRRGSPAIASIVESKICFTGVDAKTAAQTGSVFPATLLKAKNVLVVVSLIATCRQFFPFTARYVLDEPPTAGAVASIAGPISVPAGASPCKGTLVKSFHFAPSKVSFCYMVTTSVA